MSWGNETGRATSFVKAQGMLMEVCRVLQVERISFPPEIFRRKGIGEC
jgi:hypothetical protein